MDAMNVKALAKINLGLDVLKKREDGYHEVRMIMQTIHLYDQIKIKKIRDAGVIVKTNLSFLPTNENNLVYKSAKMLIDEFQLDRGVEIQLSKHIPVAAGMAGGSTDAAAVLYAMNQLFELKLKRQDLMDRGVKIGADVPYCLMRGTALAEGIGEQLKSIPPMIKCPILIAKPPISVSTKFVYDNLQLDCDVPHPDINRLIRDIRKKDLHAIASDMGNFLETVTENKYPVITQLKDMMKQNGALNAIMSGSGPTVFGLFEDERTARQAFAKIKDSGLAKQVYLTSVYNNRK